MNTQENNKMIAEFLGKDHELNQCISAPQYYTSWYWLMPVVDKIEDRTATWMRYGTKRIVSEGFKWVEVGRFSYTVQIENKSVTIWKHSDQFDSKKIIEINGNTKREATYKAVVEFINQYNKNESFD